LLGGFSHALPRGQVKSSFRTAKNHYLYGNYKEVIEHLTPLLESGSLLDGELLIQGHEMLGLAHYYLGKKASARAVFERLIRRAPEHQLSPVMVPPPAVAFYFDIREKLLPEIKQERAALEAQRAKERARLLESQTRVVYIEKRLNSRWIAVMPLGLGQFQNDDPLLGTLFLGSELLSIGLSLSFLYAMEDLRNENGRFERSDASQAYFLQQAQLISGGVALGLILLGAGQALWKFKEVGLMKRRVLEPSFERLPGAFQGGSALRWEF